MDTTEEFLIRRSYRKVTERFEWPYIMKNFYEHRLTELETAAVCEENNRLCIHIHEYQFQDRPIQYEISIIAERHGIWWDLKAYSLRADELQNRITEIENALIKAFNNL